MKKTIFIIGLILIFTTSLFAMININTAPLKELKTIKGVGEKTALAIVEYRKKNKFKSVDELIKVKGIGKKIIDKNRANLCVGKDCK